MLVAPLTKALVALSAAACVVLALRFRGTQNKKLTLGGRISRPKVVWLFFAIWFWFCLCPALALEPSLPTAYRLVFGAHAASMWLRGGVELFMLYVTKNWRPPLGIAHDVFCLLLLGGLAGWQWGHFGGSPLGVWTAVAVGALAFSLVVETLYAVLFFRAVEGQTTGEQGVWFASEDEARFKRINALTTALNVPQVGFALAFLGVLLIS